jgi:putative DNA methylase
MTAERRRKLIEVALPLEAINRESAREKSIRHGHPSTLHLWWARRPLAACRAVLFSQLVDDPSARPDLYPTEEAQSARRKDLFDFIERLVVWENTTDTALLAQAHREILASTGGNPPAILDPFAGGGSIPLEAQRLGLEAHASDLNPVAVLINKALIEIPPKWAGRPPVFPGAADTAHSWPGTTGLAEDVRRYGQWMRDEAERRIGHLYPKAKLADGSTANVIAWIWARTVTCPNPACRVEMPLVRSWWLGKKKGKEAYVVPRVRSGRVEFEIGHDVTRAPTKADDGTVTRTGARCVNPGCGTPVPLTYVRTEGQAGRIGARLMAIAAEGNRRRHYVAPTEEHEAAARVPIPDSVPDTELPEAALGFRVQAYGMTHHADLFTARQLTALTMFSDLVGEAREKALTDARDTDLDDGAPLDLGGTDAVAYADSIALYLAFALSRTTNMSAALCGWSADPKMEAIRGLFSRQAISMVWDFAEANIFAGSSGDFVQDLGWVSRAVARTSGAGHARVTQADAGSRSYRGPLVSTDPPYYDNVGYSDLADYFYVWLRRSLGSVLPSLLATMLTPKVDELVADPVRRGGPTAADEYFERGFVDVFERIRRDTPPDYPITIFYAFKQSEIEAGDVASTGWEVLLEGMIRTGWEITATWPVRTERAGRTRDIGSNALASSIVLACRPRDDAAPATSRRAFLGALKGELPSALKDLQQGSVAPVDLAQAAIGPGMAVYSRYAKVVEADGSDMTVRTALALINHALDEVLSEQEGDFDADTRFCLKWFRQFEWNENTAGQADVLARATNTSTGGLERAGVFRAVAGKARLLAPADVKPGWDPLADDRISVWEVVLHVAKVLDEHGADAAAALLAAAGQRVDLDTAKELTYLLYSVCERNGWARSGLLFNGLGTSWLDLELAARNAPATAGATQHTLDFDGETDGDE